VYLFWVAVLLGVVEGLTEFLPVSSTGHLIVTSYVVGFKGPRAEVFTIFIQLGAILAVVWEYRARLGTLVRQLPVSVESRRTAVALAVAFLPAAVVGLLVHDQITRFLFGPLPVAAALIVGGLLILLVESLPLRPRTENVEGVTWSQALWIGIAQCLALWPGFSRSAATIMGGMCAGLNRRAATEFSFFLAIPVMFAATLYDLLKNRGALNGTDWLALGLSFVVAFLVAWASIRWLLRYVSSHSFRAFAWYRLAFGLIILAVFWNLD
jgi:undecaprenyl-diphosphatase